MPVPKELKESVNICCYSKDLYRAADCLQKKLPNSRVCKITFDEETGNWRNDSTMTFVPSKTVWIMGYGDKSSTFIGTKLQKCINMKRIISDLLAGDKDTVIVDTCGGSVERAKSAKEALKANKYYCGAENCDADTLADDVSIDDWWDKNGMKAGF